MDRMTWLSMPTRSAKGNCAPCVSTATGKPSRCATPKNRVSHVAHDGRFERAPLLWQNQLLGPVKDNFVLIDGKKMRGGGVEMVNATTGSGRFLASTMTPAQSNEIPAARGVFKTQDLAGKIVIADALHTNFETAQQILQQQGGDYLLTVKGNQPELKRTLQSLFTEQGFSPEGPCAHPSHRAGEEPRAHRNPGA